MLTPQGFGNPVIMQSQDLDGEGPDAPVITVTGQVMTNTAYEGSVMVLNELESPAENITLEVLEEDDEHQFFYVVGGDVNGPTVEYTDFDGDLNPVGIETLFLTGTDETSNTLTVILRHEPNKDGLGVSDGIIDNAGGETDVEVVFNFTVSN